MYLMLIIGLHTNETLNGMERRLCEVTGQRLLERLC